MRMRCPVHLVAPVYAATGERGCLMPPPRAAWFDGRTTAMPHHDPSAPRRRRIDEDAFAHSGESKSAPRALLDRASRCSRDARPFPLMTADSSRSARDRVSRAATQSITGFATRLSSCRFCLAVRSEGRGRRHDLVGVLWSPGRMRWRPTSSDARPHRHCRGATGMPIASRCCHGRLPVLTAIIGVLPGPTAGCARSPAAQRRATECTGFARARAPSLHERTPARHRVPGHGMAPSRSGRPCGRFSWRRDRVCVGLRIFVHYFLPIVLVWLPASAAPCWRSIAVRVSRGRSARLCSPCSRSRACSPSSPPFAAGDGQPPTCSARDVNPSLVRIENSSVHATGQVENFAITTFAGPWTNTLCPLIPDPI